MCVVIYANINMAHIMLTCENQIHSIFIIQRFFICMTGLVILGHLITYQTGLFVKIRKLDY